MRFLRIRSGTLLSFATALAGLTFLTPPPAAVSNFTYYVDINSSATSDCTPTNTPGGACTGQCAVPTCGTQATPCHTIQQAINIANCNIGTNGALEADVVVAAGTYPQRASIYSNVHLIGSGRDDTTIDARGLNRAAVTMSRFGNFGFNRLEIKHSITGFRIIHGSGDLIDLTDSGGNHYFEIGGGGLALYGDRTVPGWPMVTDCRIEDNTLANLAGTAPDWMGAGIYIGRGAPIISGNIIQRNTTTPPDQSGQVQALGWGAGIFSLNFDCVPWITRNTIRNNITVAQAGNGAGIYVNGDTGTIISSNMIVANSASVEGGGIYLYANGASAYNNVVMGNTAGTGGGGIEVTAPNTGTYLANNTVVGNVLTVHVTKAPFDTGGGVYSFFILSQQADPLVHLTNNLIVQNDATSNGLGGGLYSYHTWATNDHNDYYGDRPNEIRAVDPTDPNFSDATVIGSNGNVSLNPVFTSAPTFWDHTNAAGTSGTAVVFDSTRYAVGNRIEYNDDGVSRQITAINASTKTLTFTPALTNKVCSNAVNAACTTNADCASPGTCNTATVLTGRILANWGSSISVNEDLRLTASSPIRDLGTNTPQFGTVPTTDFDNLPRPVDGDQNGSAIIDIGAFEFRFADSDGDGVPDSLDCAPLANSAWAIPDQVPNPLSVSSAQILSWFRIPQSNVYNIYSGTVTSPWTYAPACLVPEVPGFSTSINVGPAPVVGTTYYYLVGGINACGSGPLHSIPTVNAAPACPAQNQDTDGDGILNLNDNCVLVANPNQTDPDRDTVGSLCDNCGAIYNPGQEDPDADLLGSACDNCPSLYNPAQADSNLNGIGDDCEDADGDTYPLTVDCNDNNPAIHPGVPEICNGFDDNCINGIDEGGGALCPDANACTQDVCGGISGCQHPAFSDGTVCSDGNACTQTDTCQTGVCAGSNPVICTAPDTCHDPGTCAPGTGVCSTGAAKADGTTCSDGDACTQTDSCLTGICTGSNPVVCTGDDCHDPGTCASSTGICSTGPAKADGTACSDGSACTQTDSCQTGVCTGSNPVVCSTSDACHDPGLCDGGTGVCSAPLPKPDGSACEDGNACTVSDSCQSGTCQPGSLRDGDADSHPDPLCGGDDCNDTNPLVWGAPVEVGNLSVTEVSPANPTWNSQAVAAGPETTYDLVTGSVSSSAGMNFPLSTCLLSAALDTSYLDARTTPGPGNGFWYLARSRNSCGVSTYGTTTRDSSIPPCP